MGCYNGALNGGLWSHSLSNVFKLLLVKSAEELQKRHTSLQRNKWPRHSGLFNQNKNLFGVMGRCWLPWMAWIFKFNFQCLIQSNSRGSFKKKVGKCPEVLWTWSSSCPESRGCKSFGGSEYYKTKWHETLHNSSQVWKYILMMSPIFKLSENYWRYQFCQSIFWTFVS